MWHKIVVMVMSLWITFTCPGQNISGQLDLALQRLSTDQQFKHAILSLYVVDGKTGKVIFDKNSGVGLAPASCQKVVTSASAFELLGKDFQFKTYIGYEQQINKTILEGNLYVVGGGDPTLGSDRWSTTSPERVLKNITAILRKNNIQSIAGDLICDDSRFTTEPLPNGWVWEDIGNYYGAGAWGLNWLENQFDVSFKTGKSENDTTAIVATSPPSFIEDYAFTNFVTTGAKGSGDNAYLFSSPFQKNIIARGTVPPSEKSFTISGSMPDPPATFLDKLNGYLTENKIIVRGKNRNSGYQANSKAAIVPLKYLDSLLSPTLDSINDWFLKKSVNLFGEALIKMIAWQRSNHGSTDTGVAIIKEFWNKRGIEKSALKIIDGSGLSPANRLTTESLVTVMQYAKKQSWFNSFYNALPLINGTKMKDGYIGGVRSYTGYCNGKDGSEYIFAFIVNNFDGNAGTVRDKMWKVLSVIKN